MVERLPRVEVYLVGFEDRSAFSHVGMGVIEVEIMFIAPDGSQFDIS